MTEHMPMATFDNPFLRLMLVYALWSLSWMLGASLFEVYFYNMGMSIPQIYLAEGFWFVAGLAMIPLFRGFNSRVFMLGGVAIAFCSVTVLFLFPAPWAAFVFRLLVGMTHLLFWVPFNIMFYEFRKENHATLGAIYYSVGPLLSLVVPAVAGLLATAISFQALYLVSMAFFVLTFIAAAFLIESKEYRYDFILCIKSIRGLKSMVFLEGFSAAIIVGVSLPVMLLTYVERPLEFGIITSLVTIFAVLAMMFTARLSDQVQRRGSFLLPVVACFSIATILTSQAPDLVLFFAGFGLVSFFSRIFFPLPLALAVDNSKSLTDTMVGREFMLNLGRLAGVLVGYAALAYADIRLALLLQGAALLLFIPIFNSRKGKLAKH
ncbi:MAG: MFS transporter [Candidatus Micrarchaeota archaeon]